MKVILNADDFGISEDTVHATIDCFEQAALTSATIMAGTPATAAAIAYARDHPEWSFGVHLQLTGDGGAGPVSGRDTVPSLVGDDGRFLATNAIRARALLRRLPADELDREVEAQLACVRDAGIDVTHVDSHRHVHKLPVIRESLRRVLPRFGITRVRTVQDVYLRKPLASPTYWAGASLRRGLARSFSTTEHLYLPSSAHDLDWAGALIDRCAQLGGQTLEVGVHPGPGTDWRAEEQASTLAFAAAARGAGHELVSWAAIL